jgi:hypothetical protein
MTGSVHGQDPKASSAPSELKVDNDVDMRLCNGGENKRRRVTRRKKWNWKL